MLNAEEQNQEKLEKKIDEIVNEIAQLKTIAINHLLEKLKIKFKITEDNVSLSSSSANDSKKKEADAPEQLSKVSIEILGLVQQEGLEKVQAYKAIVTAAKSLGVPDITLMQAKQLVDKQSTLAVNVELNQAKTIQEQLIAKGVQIKLK